MADLFVISDRAVNVRRSPCGDSNHLKHVDRLFRSKSRPGHANALRRGAEGRLVKSRRLALNSKRKKLRSLA